MNIVDKREYNTITGSCQKGEGGFGDVLAEFLFLKPGTLQAFFHLTCYLKSGGLSIKTCWKMVA